MFSKIMGTLLGDNAKPETNRPDTTVPRLVHWLPYRSYDPKTHLFYNSASRGFVLEATPMMGANERTSEILTQFLSEGIPTPGTLQFHGWMSPRVGTRLSQWYLP
ncbi:TraC family protein, partial [Sphingobium yanoikuyae]